jgi:hypothetical protein
VGGELLGEVAAEDLRPADHVLEVLRVQQLAARLTPLEHHGAEHGAGAVQGAGESGRAGADDDEVELVLGGHEGGAEGERQTGRVAPAPAAGAATGGGRPRC